MRHHWLDFFSSKYFKIFVKFEIVPALHWPGLVVAWSCPFISLKLPTSPAWSRFQSSNNQLFTFVSVKSSETLQGCSSRAKLLIENKSLPVQYQSTQHTVSCSIIISWGNPIFHVAPPWYYRVFFQCWSFLFNLPVSVRASGRGSKILLLRSPAWGGGANYRVTEPSSHPAM